MRQMLRVMARGLTLRCANCGGGGLLASWFHLEHHCPHCGLQLERGEGEDYFLGGMMFNIVLSELVYAAIMIAWMMITWPNVPWDLLEYVGIPFMVIAPVLFYPVSKTVWLAFDVLFRPVRPEELSPSHPR